MRVTQNGSTCHLWVRYHCSTPRLWITKLLCNVFHFVVTFSLSYQRAVAGKAGPNMKVLLELHNFFHVIHVFDVAGNDRMADPIGLVESQSKLMALMNDASFKH